MRCWFAISFFVALPAAALSNRVFVASSGIDVGTCTITAPCRSFSYGMTQVAPAGEVIALDTAGYGVFAIGKSVSVVAAPGATAFIAVGSGGTGIDIEANPTDVIVLRGLALSSAGGSFGILFQIGASLAVENCVINGFQNNGVFRNRLNDTSNPSIRIENSTIRNNYYGVYTISAGTGVVGLTIVRSRINDNSIGLFASDNTRAAVSDTTLSGNFTAVESATANDNSTPQLSLVRCTIAQNEIALSAGLNIGQNPHGVIRIAHNLITANNTAINENPDGKIMTMTSAGTATNVIEGNLNHETVANTYNAK